MSKCDYERCEGHLGKFSSCLAEAVWQSSLDGADETTGRTEAYGHYALMLFNFDEALPLGDKATITVPAGAYIVQSTNQGFVYLLEYDTEAKAREDFAQAEKDYGEWLDENEPE